MFPRFMLSLLVAALVEVRWAEAGCGVATEALVEGGVSRNASGHWTAIVRMETNVKAKHPHLLLRAEPSVRRCNGTLIQALTVTVTGDPLPPSAGYQKTEWIGSYYKIHEQATWEEAKMVCERENAHLLVLNSREEAEAIYQLLEEYPEVTGWVHIGFTDEEKEGEYVTIFGESLAEAGYSIWKSGEPTDTRSENCGSIWADTMGLNDVPCTKFNAYFICEQPA